MIVSVVDYGVGNLHSISKGIERSGARVEVVREFSKLPEAECIVFPGVGAFGAAMEQLRPVSEELRSAILSGTPALGVCLGMQILFDSSDESAGSGLSILKGDVRRLKGDRIPHMGWNDVLYSDDPLFDGVPQGSKFYYANSFVCHPIEKIGISETHYGETFVSAVRQGTVYGVQFHPEKSGSIGLKLLSNFVRIAEESA